MKNFFIKLMLFVLCGVLLVSAPKVSVAGAEVLSGDINGDSNVNNKDLTRLFQHLSGWEVIVNTDLLDINGDGKVNNKDLTRLFQYLSGWEVDIFPARLCEHTNSQWVVTEEPTYIKEGIKSLICQNCGETLETASVPKITVSDKLKQMEEGMLSLMNAERAKEGVNPLSFDYERYPCAQLRAEEITELFSHTRPSGESCFTVINELGYSYAHTCGENIAYYGYYGLESDTVTGYTMLHNNLMNSEGHRSNILSEKFTSVALAFTIKNNRLYVVQMFFG